MKSTTLTLLIILSLFIFLGAVAWMSTIRHHLVFPEKQVNALYSLEMAGSKDRVAYVITTWEQAGKKEVAWKLNMIDFLLIAGYSFFYFFSIRKLATVFPNRFGRWVRPLSVLAVLPGTLDVIEGIASNVWLSGSIDSYSPQIIFVFAFIKFLIAIPMAIFILGGFGILAFTGKRNHG